MIHVDRMCKKYPQTLRGEACDEERSAPENGPESLDIEDSNLEHNEQSDRSDDEDDVMPQRSRRKPVDGRLCSVLVKAIASSSAIIVYSHLHMRDAYFPERRVM